MAKNFGHAGVLADTRPDTGIPPQTISLIERTIMKPNAKLRFFLLVAGSFLLAISSTSAQSSGTWLGNGDAWNLTSAWSGGTIATGSGSTANFTGVNLTSDVSASDQPSSGLRQDLTYSMLKVAGRVALSGSPNHSGKVSLSKFMCRG
jgi:hypothetical protein